MKIQSLIATTLALAGLVAPPTVKADAVTDWNEIMQTTVAAGNANVQARSAAIVQLAVFEAVNSIVGDYEPYLGTIAAPEWASPDAAAAAAAHAVLVALYPASNAVLNASLAGVARDDPGRSGQGCRHCSRRGRRDRHAAAPRQRWRRHCRKRALHPGNEPRRLAAGTAHIHGGFPARLGTGDSLWSRSRLAVPLCHHRHRSTAAGMRGTTTRSNSWATQTPARTSVRKIGPMSRASSPFPRRCRVGIRPRARSARRKARPCPRTRESSPCWAWPFAMPRSLRTKPSIITTPGGR